MLRKLVLLAALLCFTPYLFADDGEDQIAYERAIHTLNFDVVKGQDALKKFLKAYPKSAFRSSASFRLYRSHDNSKAQRVAALQVLRDLQNSTDSDYVNARIWKCLRDDYGWRAASLSGWRRSKFLSLPITAHSGPDSHFSLYKISDKDYFAAYKKIALENTKEKVDSPPASKFRGSKKLIAKKKIEKWSIPTKRSGFWRSSSIDDIWRLPKTLTGAYILRETIGGFHNEQIVIFSSYGIVAKPIGKKVLVYTLDPVGGNALPDVTLTYCSDGINSTKKTGADGCALFDFKKSGRIIAERGHEVRVCDFKHSKQEKIELVYISTDRPIYRPSQTIHFKGIHRKLLGSKLGMKANDSVQVEIRDPNDRILKTYTKTWSEFGTLTDSFKLAAEPTLGTYSIQFKVARTPVRYPGVLNFDDEEEFWSKEFEVRSYRKPYGKVTITLVKAATATANAKAKIHAEYFHGGPVKNASVKWNLARAYLWYDNTNLTYRYAAPFNDPLDWLYKDLDFQDDYDWAFDEDDMSNLDGEGVTDANGDLLIEFPMKATIDPVEYTIDAEVEDDSRLSVGAAKSFRFNESSVQMSVGAKTMFGVDGESITAVVMTKNSAGQALANTKVQLSVFLAEEPFGKYGAEYESLKKLELVTNSLGLAECVIPLTGSGRVRLRARTFDSQKRRVEARSEIWSAGPNSINPNWELPYLDIMPEKAVFEHGQAARFLVRANAYPLHVFLTIEGRELLDYKFLTITKPSQLITLPMLKSYGSNIDIRLQAWKDDQSYGAGFNVYLHSQANEVKVKVSTDKKNYAPGEEATVLVETSSAGHGQASELEFVIVDNKIFEIMPDLSRDLRRFFLVIPFAVTRVFSSLSVNQEHSKIGDMEVLDPDMGGSGGGGGGAGGVLTFDDEEDDGPNMGVGVGQEKLMELIERAKDNAAFENTPAKTRKWFPDTMIFKGHATTDSNGKKVFKLKMPDSLTSWRILARAVTKTHKFGFGRSEVLTRQDILVRLVLPRFYTVGDEGLISTIVYNNSEKAAVFTVSLSSKELAVLGKSRLVKIGPKSQMRLDWKVSAANVGLATVEAKALSPLGSDAVSRTIPVKSKGVKYAVSKSEFFLENWKGDLVLPKNALKDSGALEIYVGTGPSSAIKQALPYLARYPYGCVEQTMSRFLPAIVASQAIKKQGLNVGPLKNALPSMVAMGLQRLYNFQHEDGGWGWWKHDETHPFMTTYVVFGLIHAKKAGYEVDETTLANAYEALEDLDQTPFWHYVQSLLNNKDAAEELKEFEIPDDVSAKDLAFLVLAGRTDLAAKLPKNPPKNRAYGDVVASALVLKAYNSLTSKDAVITKRIQAFSDWLLKARRGRAWVTTLDSAYAVFALCDLVKKGALGSLTVNVNGNSISAEKLESGLFIPAKYLKTGKNSIEVKGAQQRLNVSATLSYSSIVEQAVKGKRKLWITRTLEKASYDDDGEKNWSIIPSGSTVKRGTEMRIRVVLQAAEDLPYIMIETPIFAGCESVDDDTVESYWNEFWYQRKELRDDRISVATPMIDEGLNEFSVPLKLTAPGTYHVRPAEAYNMYDTAIRAVSKPLKITIVD
ncbi:MAG: alpha-2-macroglobulin family protein [Planctomycetota bacterium]|nr:alpha-2-macroglobulin family protein [Planctomycetota bacterium]